MLEKLDFGSYTGENDVVIGHPEVFVETKQFEGFRLPQHRIIIGRKGSGKTALERALARLAPEEYGSHLFIDAEKIRFRPLTEGFREYVRAYGSLEKAAGGTLELKKTMTNIWEHAILTSCMCLLHDKEENPNASMPDITRYLRREGHLKRRISDILVDSVQALLSSFLGKKGEAISHILHTFDDYPLRETSFLAAREELKRLVAQTKGILVTFDRIDLYFEVERRPYAAADEVEAQALKNALFGLIQATVNISTSNLGQKLHLKVFLPKDKYDSLAFRDWIKASQFRFEITWTADELREFIARRIAYSLNVRDSKGRLRTDAIATWYAVFPRVIHNKQMKNTKESVVAYLLRHSLYRPRDLQVFCHRAMLIARSEGKHTIDEDSVRRGVHEGSLDLVKDLLHEFQYEYPFLPDLIELFHGSSNILSYGGDFYPRIQKFAAEYNLDVQSNKLVDILFDVGFVGGIGGKPNHEGSTVASRKISSKVHYFYFSHCAPTFNLRMCDEVAIHPLFYDYLHLTPNGKLIIG